MKENLKYIKGPGNYYGGIYVTEFEGKFYWLIENYDTDFENPEEWEEITKELFDSLIDHDKNFKP